jgi:hypothetical protein
MINYESDKRYGAPEQNYYQQQPQQGYGNGYVQQAQAPQIPSSQGQGQGYGHYQQSIGDAPAPAPAPAPPATRNATVLIMMLVYQKHLLGLVLVVGNVHQWQNIVLRIRKIFINVVLQHVKMNLFVIKKIVIN